MPPAKSWPVSRLFAGLGRPRRAPAAWTDDLHAPTPAERDASPTTIKLPVARFASRVEIPRDVTIARPPRLFFFLDEVGYLLGMRPRAIRRKCQQHGIRYGMLGHRWAMPAESYDELVTVWFRPNANDHAHLFADGH